MLVSLRIQNFALIDELNLCFGPQLNVLTGETGAGKSILLDALEAALGGRVTSRMIRSGAERALVEATFQLDSELMAGLAEQAEMSDLKRDPPTPHSPNQLICRRELGFTKGNLRSRSRLNGVVVNKRKMELVRARLVEITAQGQTMQLGNVGLQQAWLDAFGGPKLLKQRAIVATHYGETQAALQALDRRRQAEQHRLQQLDVLEYQSKELDAAALTTPDELELLEQERQRLSHSVELKQQSYQVYQALYQNDEGQACSDLLGQAENWLTDMVQYDPQIQGILDLVNGALAQVEAAGWQINAYGEALETDPARLQNIEARVTELKQLCRKYGPTLAEAIAHRDQIQAELAELNDGGQSLDALEQAYQTHHADLTQACGDLTALRQAAGNKLERQLLKALKPLAMEKVQFKVEIQPGPHTAMGADQIQFLFSANPGEPLSPLTEVASGGEMSRFLLALKTCFSKVDKVSTMVFDEVDVGVSGRVTQAIAEKLHQLSQQHQVLCVTHQPIVAAMADAHFRVEKHIRETKKDSVRTIVKVSSLAEHQRREELAQLAGGQSDQEAIAFAESLLAQAANIRQATAAH